MSENSVNTDRQSLMKKALLELKQMKSQLDALETAKKEPIAIVGMGCRFPGNANSPEAFWQLLRDGVDAVTEVPPNRWDINAFYDSNPDTPGKMSTRHGGFVSQLEEFDAQFFGISPREAVTLDPQQRLLLEVSWEALENAAIKPDTLVDSQTGVFIGICSNDYLQRLFARGTTQIDAYQATGNTHSVAAGRLSYLLGLTGPSLAVDTACSSSLVAVHLACQSLRNQECNLAIAGGVNLMISPEFSINFSKARMLSTDGRCKTFDASANGYVRGEGCGAIVLKRLSDAIKDKDPILALIRGSAVNQDGRSSGLTAPNGPSQQAVIRQALENSGVESAEISYLEVHGTGTALGDPIEVGALGAVFGNHRPKDQPLTIASVKTNIGHLEAAAGIAGLIKVVLQMQHQEIAPHLHFQQPSPHIDWENLPLIVPKNKTFWQTTEKSRLAGVSSFGFSGTNAHVVLEQAPISEPVTPSAERPLHLLTLSAKTAPALRELAQRYATYLQLHPEVNIADMSYTMNTGRSHFLNRLAVVSPSIERFQEQLIAFADGGETSGLSSRQLTQQKPPKIVFLFTGQGSQYINMGSQLYQTQPVFRQALEQCNEILRPYLEGSLLEIMYPAQGGKEVSSLLDQTAYTQPALFAFEYALCQLWKSWGIEPNVVMGHSIGEYVAAAIAGVFSLEDGLKLIAHRGKLMQQLPTNGEMVSLMASEKQVKEIIADCEQRVALAAINGPESVVISGASADISAICHQLEALSIKTKRLQVSHAFHSPLMKPMLAKFAAIANQVTYRQPRIPIVSNITGKIADTQIATSDYWVSHVCQTVRFAESMQTLHQQGYQAFLEIGPKPILLSMGYQCLPDSEALWLASLRSGIPEWQQILSSLGELYLAGVKIDWLGFERDYPHKKLALPTYPFQRQRYWIQQVEETMNEQENGNKPKSKLAATLTASRREEILATLQTLVGNLLQLSPADVNIHAPFLEMGADSIILVEAVRRIENTYSIKVAIRQLFEELTTIYTLATYIEQNLSSEWVNPNSPQQSNFKEQPQHYSTPESSLHSPQNGENQGIISAQNTLERIMSQQLQVMSGLMSQQLEVLRGNGSSAKSLLSSHEPPQSNQAITPTVYSPPKEQQNQITSSKLETEQPSASPNADIQRQKYHIEVLSDRYNQRHQKSKQLAQTYRPVLADSRGTAGFRPSIKEMVYPIAGERAQGSRFWDVDGNEYIDITMGFGVLLFGHAPQFVTEALEKHNQQGLKIGPQSKLAGEVAQLICELTGMERAVFCNSGTEAIMTALRLARSATGRTKVALFSGSYHGHFDAVLVTAAKNEIKAVPLASGISQNLVEDILVLDYGDPKSLEILQLHAHELAAVLVEPVQSRRPDLQPKEFLQQLRQLTQASGTALIFDEVLTGFRVHPGGTQAWFGVKADIATYGKIIGGGTPIGVVAGSATYMNAIDGGLWNYGDASYPQAEKTFFAGTFNKNHTGMVAALAVLQHLKSQGPTLQQNLNQRTRQLAQTLNSFFEEENVPIRVVHFSSLFRFVFSANLDLLFYHLLDKGIYIWEGRICFLSTAHTDADIDYLIQAVKDSIKELREGGFLPSGSSKLLAIENTPNGTEKKQSQEIWKQNGFVLQKEKNLSSVNSVSTQDITYLLPLTEAQKQLWILAQLGEASSVAYNESVTLQLRGRFKATAMEKAIQKLVDRHESLRTKISPKGDVQEILPSIRVDCPLLDFSCVDGNGTVQVTEWFNQESQKPFNLTQCPLLRVHLLKLEPELYLLVLTAHHIVVDGWSMGVILRELGALYSAESQGTICQIDPPKQFREYIEWQNQQSQVQEMKIHQAYWLGKLTIPPVLDLPTDRIRPPIQTYNSSRETIKLDAQVTNNLKLFSQQQGCTLLMSLLSVFMTLIHRLTGQDDIIIGVPTSGRSLLGSEGMVGYCAHFLPIRSQLADNPSFAEYLKQMRGTLLEAYEHQDYPFAQLLNQLNLPTDNSRSPLVNVSFNLDKSITLPEMSQLETSLLSQDVAFNDRDLHLNILQIAGELLVECDYNTDLFDVETIGRWLNHFQILLQAVITEPEQHLRELPLLTPAQQHQLLVEWNDTQADYPQDKCIHQLFEEQVERTPDAVAVVFENQQLTYHQLNCRANQLAHYLKSLGVSADVLVGICVERSIEMLVGLLAILKAGGAYVPLDPTYPQERLAYMLNDSQVLLLLTQDKLVSSLPQHGAHLVCLDTNGVEICAESEDNPLSSSKTDNLAYVIYTSGSTGQPKGTLVNHSNVVRLFAATELWYNFNSQDVWTLFHSYAFDFSVWEIWGALLYGGQLVVVPYLLTRSPEDFYKLLCQEKVTVLNQTPSAFYQLIRTEESLETTKELSLRLVIFGGEALDFQNLRPWFERHGDQYPQLVNMYGITETTVHVTYRPVTLKDLETASASSIGRPIPDLQVYLLDQHQQPVPIGVPGEMYIGGAGVVRGYLNRDRLTALKFVPHLFSNKPNQRLYRSGDLARYLPNGELEYLGRIDNQVKIRGFRIELGEIENTLAKHEVVQETVVLARETQDGKTQLVAYVVPNKQQTLTTSDLRNFLVKLLPDYMVPSAFVLLEALPLTANGKVDRRALPAPDTARPELEDVFVAPNTIEEKILATIWANVLGVEQVGIKDNFFALGGDSIRSIQVLSQAKEQGLSFSVQQLFQHQTIHELVQELKTQENDITKSELTQPFSLISTADKQHLPDSVEDAYPLGMLQMGMIYHSEYSQDSAVYHDIFSFHLKTPFNIELLQVAIQNLVNYHAALRTSFDLSNFSVPLQLVYQQVEIPLQVEDWCHLNHSEQEEALAVWFEAEKKRYFDWTHPPLVRFFVHRRTQETLNFTVSFHHAILDGWSVASMMSEFFKRYLSLLGEGVDYVLPQLSITFRDFVALEQQAIASSSTQRYWSENLNDSTFTKLPRWSFVLTNTNVREVGVQEITLSPEIFVGLKQLAQFAEVPLKNVLLAAHLRVLNFLSGELNVLTGVVANGRPEQNDGERVLGLFLNTLPFRLQLAGGTWIDLVQQVFATEQEMLPHRRYPLAEIQRSLGGEPLFETAFNFTHFHVYKQALELDNLQLLGGKFFEQTNFTFLAQFNVSPNSSEITLNLQYDSCELCSEQVNRISDYYHRVLVAMANEPQGRYELHSLVSLEERHQLLVEWNQTAVDHPLDKCIHQLFEEQVERTPDAVAVVFENQQLTYHQLNCRANQLAHYLKSLGVSADVLVGICVERSLEMVIGLLGILKAGGAYVPLDPDYPQDRLSFMLEDAQLPVLLTQQTLVEKLPEHQAQVVCLDTHWQFISQSNQDNPFTGVQVNNLAYVIYTSGSTGKPKGAMNTHLGICNRLLWMQQAYQLTATDCVLQKTPFSFDVSVWEFFWPLLTGARLVVAEPGGHKDSAYLVNLIREQQITTLHFVPSMLQIFLEEQGLKSCSSLKRVICSGEALPKELQERFFTRLGCELHNLYGPTEAAIDVTFWQCQPESNFRIVPIGRPIANTQIYILNSNLQPLPVGVPGELHIGGAGLARGYLNRPELTTEKFIPNPFSNEPHSRLYKTGDLARYLSDGNIEYLERIDNQVKIRGFRIELGEVEALLSQYVEVQASCVIAREDNLGDKYLVAYVVPHQHSTPTISQLRQFLLSQLPAYMVPNAFVMLETLPLTPNGKIDRRALPSPDPELSRSVAYVVPRNSTEKAIADIFTQVLQVEKVGIYDNFFEIGGNSLKATQIVSRLRETLSLEFPLRRLLEQPTVADLAQSLEEMRSTRQKLQAPVSNSLENWEDIDL